MFIIKNDDVECPLGDVVELWASHRTPLPLLQGSSTSWSSVVCLPLGSPGFALVPYEKPNQCLVQSLRGRVLGHVKEASMPTRLKLTREESKKLQHRVRKGRSIWIHTM